MSTATELHCPPLYGTRRSFDRPTLGPQAARIAEQLGKPFLPHQRLIADVALELDPATGYLAYDEVVIVGPRQVTGKALDVDTPLWTARGWVPIGEVRAGDRVAHPDGHFTEVVFASDVMHDHACYRVTTVDGRSVVADADHLWRVRDTFSGGSRPWRTMTTAEIASAGLRNRGNPGGYRFRLPIQQAVKTPDIPLPLDPYILGMWLGDGTAANSSMTVGVRDVDHVRQEIEAAGLVVKSAKQDRRTGAWALWMTTQPYAPTCSDVSGCDRATWRSGLCHPHYKRAWRAGTLPAVRKTMNAILGDLGVIRNKHVPGEYLAAGHGQRLALLQGLMDTDGCITANGTGSPRCEFTSTNRALADAALLLARSLGWRATLIEGRATLAGRDCGPKWRVAFTATSDDPPPFRLARKASMIRGAMPRTDKRTAVSISEITPVESRPVRCIKVASPDGLFLAGRDLMATHNTELMLPMMTHRCTGFGDELARWVKAELGHTVVAPGPQKVLYTTQTADKAREKWRDIHLERLKKSVFQSKIHARLKTNQEAIMWPNGSTWSPGSTTGKTSGTGDTLDMPVIDESWSRPDNRTEIGMRPAMMTRKWSQLWSLSMIPGLSRSLPGTWPYLHQKRQNGRARVQADIRRGMAYFEWSAPKDQGMDPGDESTWWSCMPALGHTVDPRRVRSDFESLDLVDFCAEYLGWEPEAGMAQWNVISETTWKGLVVPNVRSAYRDPVAIGLDAHPDLTAGSIGMAALTPDGDTFVELIERKPDINWMVDAMVAIARRTLPCAVGVAAHGPCAPLIKPLEWAFRDENIDCPVVVFQGPDVSKACRQFYVETGESGGEVDPDEARSGRRIAHIDQDELNASIGTASKYVYSDEWRWARSGAGGDASPLYSVTMARAAGESVEWIGGSYDIADSLG